MANITANNSFKVIVNGEQRTGYCEDCNARTVKELYMDGERRRVHMICPVCGGQGRLIARTYSIQAPVSPKNASFKSLWKFIKDVWFCSFLSMYHKERVNYATHNRHKDMKEKYRTGEPSPKTIMQSLMAIMELKLNKIRGC